MAVHAQNLVRIGEEYGEWLVVRISGRCNLIYLAGMLLTVARYAETLKHESEFEIPIQRHLRELKCPSSKVTVLLVRRTTLQVFVMEIQIQSPLT